MQLFLSDKMDIADPPTKKRKRETSDTSERKGEKKQKKLCKFHDCDKSGQGYIGGFCAEHGKKAGVQRKKWLCKFEGCKRWAQKGGLCISHGGGHRCEYFTFGSDADIIPCRESALGNTSFCRKHGGGKICIISGCIKRVQGRTTMCRQHFDENLYISAVSGSCE